MAIDELRLGRVFRQVAQKHSGLRDRPADDCAGVRAQEQRFAAGPPVDANERMADGAEVIALLRRHPGEADRQRVWHLPAAPVLLAIPRELEEAAIIDCAGYFRIYWKIILPLSRPILSALAILFFLAKWKSSLWHLTITSNQDFWLVQVAIASFRQQYNGSWNHGGFDRRRPADAGDVRGLSEAHHRVDQDYRHQVNVTET
jgi:hypothetical protein